jgi:hypothetical protein
MDEPNDLRIAVYLPGAECVCGISSSVITLVLFDPLIINGLLNKSAEGGP